MDSTRVLILSADVAGGHDAAARALADDIRRDDPHAEVLVDNGLELASPFFRRAVRDFYKAQLTYSPMSYRVLFRIITIRWVIRAIWGIVPFLYARQLRRKLLQIAPTMIISTYPVVTTMLGGLRRQGKLTVPTIAIVTDVDPHGMWFAPGVDQHLVSVVGDVDRVAAAYPHFPVRAGMPPIKPGFFLPRDRGEARALFGVPAEGTVVLVSGGAWGVGGMAELVEPILNGTDAFCIVACGTNASLLRSIQRDYPADRVLALPFCDDMPGLFAASDAVVHTAAGLTAFEALVTRTPIVIVNPIGGHGVRSAHALVADGLAVWARSDAELVAFVTDGIGAARESQRSGAERMSALPGMAALSTSVAARPLRVRKRDVMRVPRVAAVLASTFVLGFSGFTWMESSSSPKAEAAERHVAHATCVTRHDLAHHVDWVRKHHPAWSAPVC